MIHISRRPIKPEVLERVFGLIFVMLGRRRDKGEFETVITALFSKTEKIMIGKRLAVYFLLVKNIAWTDIVDTLKVSVSLISKCAMTLQNNAAFERVVIAMAKHDIFIVQMEDLINSLIANPGYSLSNWKNAWRRKKDTQRKKNIGI